MGLRQVKRSTIPGSHAVHGTRTRLRRSHEEVPMRRMGTRATAIAQEEGDNSNFGYMEASTALSALSARG
jgi:hypothetical protein